ncbi:MAG: hypothetical protein ACOX6D_09960 [Thermoguttaceae bacterium]|jgi:hypothetical protein
MKSIVPGPLLCFVLHRFYHRPQDFKILCGVLEFLVMAYLFLHIIAWLTNSYTLIFNDEFSGERYGLVRHRVAVPGMQSYMLLVSLFYISNMDRRFSKVASFQKWLHFVIYIYFIVFIYMSKSYLIATMIPIIAFMIYKRVLNILALLSLSLILIVGGILWTSNGIVKEDNIISYYYDDFVNDTNHSAEPRKEGLVQYYSLFKETNTLGFGHAAIHYDRRVADLVEKERIQYVDIGVIGVFYQYGVPMLIVSIVIITFMIKNLIEAAKLSNPMIRNLSNCLSFFLIYLLLSLTPLWLHEGRAFLFGFILYCFMLIEDEIERENLSKTASRIKTRHSHPGAGYWE